MSLPCRLVDIEKLLKQGEKPKPGDMWFAPWIGNDHSDLSPEYKFNWRGKRPPLFVTLPNGRIWCVDFTSSEKYRSWIVRGVPPQISVYPSVNSPGGKGYHGLLICGFFCDDLEGRTND
ncbi:MAG: hypothetical protein FH756_14350 [Firmicutes bacterium]|nr:hypothetical protein [Bacillota bacterium]